MVFSSGYAIVGFYFLLAPTVTFCYPPFAARRFLTGGSATHRPEMEREAKKQRTEALADIHRCTAELKADGVKVEVLGNDM
eukprot:27101-Eustigmatos_ZCMA.PRE.1